MLIEGAIAIKAAIANKRRDVMTVYLDKNKKSHDFNYIRKQCHQNKITLEECSSAEIMTMASGKSHGGILAEVGFRRYESANHLFLNNDIFYLDGIEDPFNLAYVLRTLCAFGFKAVILPEYDYRKFEGTLLKSSAGAFDILNIALSKDIKLTLEQFKKEAYCLYALYRGPKAKDLFKITLAKKALYLVGGEKRGIKAKVLDEVDELCFIPYGFDFKMALSAASSADVLATLVYEKRNYQ